MAIEQITISVNGENRSAHAGATLMDLLQELGVSAARVAIERNREVVPREKWRDTRVEPGDRLEIVQFVGGG